MKIQITSLTVLIVAICLGGCDVGNAPAGASQEEMRATFDKQPLDDRAKMVLAAAMAPDEKVKRVKELYQKEGKPIPPEIEKQLGGSATGH